MASLLSGANLVHDVGQIGQGSLVSMETMVLWDEIIGMCRQFTSGIEISPRTLALDLIHERGPGGEFLTAAHTVENYRRDWWFPRVFSRERYVVEEPYAGPDLNERLSARVREIIEKHRVEELDADTMKDLDALAAKWRQGRWAPPKV